MAQRAGVPALHAEALGLIPGTIQTPEHCPEHPFEYSIRSSPWAPQTLKQKTAKQNFPKMWLLIHWVWLWDFYHQIFRRPSPFNSLTVFPVKSWTLHVIHETTSKLLSVQTCWPPPVNHDYSFIGGSHPAVVRTSTSSRAQPTKQELIDSGQIPCLLYFLFGPHS